MRPFENQGLAERIIMEETQEEQRQKSRKEAENRRQRISKTKRALDVWAAVTKARLPHYSKLGKYQPEGDFGKGVKDVLLMSKDRSYASLCYDSVPTMDEATGKDDWHKELAKEKLDPIETAKAYYAKFGEKGTFRKSKQSIPKVKTNRPAFSKGNPSAQLIIFSEVESLIGGDEYLRKALLAMFPRKGKYQGGHIFVTKEDATIICPEYEGDHPKREAERELRRMAREFIERLSD